MAEVTANLQIQFASSAADTPFELVVDDTEQEGSTPVQVFYVNSFFVYLKWFNMGVQESTESQATDFEPLSKMVAPGRKRIKVYCSLADTPHIKIMVDNGEKKYSYIELKQNRSEINVYSHSEFSSFSVPRPQYVTGYTSTVVTTQVNYAKPISRISAPIVEAITWTGEQRKRLKYFYDQPSVEIIQKTVFFDKNGMEIPAPVYESGKRRILYDGRGHRRDSGAVQSRFFRL